MKYSSRLILALALFAAPLFTHAEFIGSPSSPTPQATINNINLNNSFTPSGPSGFLPTQLPTQKKPSDQGAPDKAPSSTFVPLVPIPGLTEGVVANSQGLANFLNNLYKYLIGVAAVLAVIMITWGGLEIATQDSVSKQGAGRKKIQEALYGLVLVLSPALVFGIINPSILDLNFAKSLKPLDIHNAKIAQVSNQTPVAPKTGCTTTHTGPYLETAVCANQNDASSYSCKNGLNLTAPGCQGTKDANGNCLDKGTQVYCGQYTTVTYYRTEHQILLATTPGVAPGQVIPQDTQTQTDFEQKCAADGGKMTTSITTAGLAWLTTHTVVLGISLISNGCPSNANIVIPADQHGAVCYSEGLSCIPN